MHKNVRYMLLKPFKMQKDKKNNNNKKKDQAATKTQILLT